MKHHRGFTLIEVLIATSIIFMLIATLMPLTSLLSREKSLGRTKIEITTILHNELQPFLWNEQQLPSYNKKIIYSKLVSFSYTEEGNYIKGCANWTNVKQEKDTICLYGIPEK